MGEEKAWPTRHYSAVTHGSLRDLWSGKYVTGKKNARESYARALTQIPKLEHSSESDTPRSALYSRMQEDTAAGTHGSLQPLAMRGAGEAVKGERAREREADATKKSKTPLQAEPKKCIRGAFLRARYASYARYALSTDTHTHGMPEETGTASHYESRRATETSCFCDGGGAPPTP